MTEEPGQQRLDELDSRLRHARETQEKKRPKTTSSGNAMGAAFRVSFELVLGVMIGTAAGWYIDQWLGTIPLFLIIFFFLGFAAGLRNVFRAAGKVGSTASDEEKESPDEGNLRDEDED